MIIPLARVVSTLFTPMIALLVAASVAIARSTESNIERIVQVGAIVGIFVAIGLFRLVLVRRGIVDDWDVRDRTKRPRLLLSLFIITSIYAYVVKDVLSPEVVELFLLFLLWVAGFFVVTLFWKISGHTGIAMLVSGLMVLWYGWSMWPGMAIVMLVAWSRVMLRHHTVAQTVAGVMYSTIVLLVFTSYLQVP